MTAKTKNGVLVGLAVLIALAALLKAWFTTGQAAIGLWGVELCDHGCHSIRWDNVPGVQDDWYLAGYVACAAALLGAGSIIAHVIGNRSAAHFARKVLVVALVAMAYFIVRAFVTDDLNHVDIGWALLVGPAATIATFRLLEPTR
jgi:hypothetical protein